MASRRAASRFELAVDDRVAGFLRYERTESTLSLIEIDTDLSLAGQGLGLVLVRGALDAASAEGLSGPTFIALSSAPSSARCCWRRKTPLRRPIISRASSRIPPYCALSLRHGAIQV